MGSIEMKPAVIVGKNEGDTVELKPVGIISLCLILLLSVSFFMLGGALASITAKNQVIETVTAVCGK